MKILQLHLKAIGPFTNRTLDLSAGNHGLHLIYGPNEAGKTSALRAIRQLFYGIDAQTNDDFEHSYQNLRIGATLRHSDGNTLAFFRRKGNKNTLLDAADQSPIPDAELTPHLGGISSDIFRTMFGIDHERLTAGGREIVEGHGELGEVLFLAGSGITRLQSVRRKLDERMGELFKLTGRKPRINSALSEWREKKNEIRRIQLSSDEWAKHKKALDEAENHLVQTDQQLKALAVERSRLERYQRAVPLITKLRQRQAELGPVADAVILPPDFSKRHRDAETELALAAQAFQRADARIAELETEIEAIDVPTDLLAQAEVIDALYRRLGSVQKAIHDKPALEVRQQAAQAEAEAILAGLRPGFPTDRAAELRVKRTDVRRIRDRATERASVFSEAENAQTNLEDVQRELKQLREQLSGMTETPDPSQLRDRCERIQEQGKLEAKFEEERQELQSLEADCERELDRMQLWSKSLADLERYPLPADETVNRFETGFEQVERCIAELQRDRQQCEEEIRGLEQRLDAIRIDKNVPSEAELVDARSVRDSGWKLVRRAWLDGAEDGPEGTAFIATFDPAADLPEAYERSVEVADEIGDRLRHESEQVAIRANLESTRNAKATRLDRLNDDLTEVEAKRDGLQSEWAQLWPRLDGEPLPPKEMRVWLLQCRGLLERAAETRRQSEAVGSLEKSIEEHRRELSRLVSDLDQSPAAETTLDELLLIGQTLVKSIEKGRDARQKLESEIEKLAQAEIRAEVAIRKASAARNEWENAWTADMQLLGLNASSTPQEANEMLDGLSDLFEKLKEADRLGERIVGIDTEADSFREDVRTFVNTFASDLAPLAPEQAAAAINARVGQARSAQQHLETLQKELDGQKSERANARKTSEDCRVLLKEMCREAGCETTEELEAAEERSRTRTDLETEISELQDGLREISGGLPLEEFLKEAGQVNPDSLGFELAQIDEQSDERQKERDALRDKIRDEEHARAQMDGNAAAAELEETSQEIIAGLERDVEEYARLKLASQLLQKGIERFRANNQMPVLTRTGEIFRDLTLGSFSGLRDDYDDAGRAVLMGIRNGSEQTIPVDAMSDGTCDQLYLALRIAGLEMFLDRHEPIPFIVDDVLVNFDDERAVAALQALAELSKRTQVLFFTHHRHLVDLATQRLPDSVVFLHDCRPSLGRL